MARYTSLSQAQIDAILAEYPLKPREVAPLSGGAANSSYLVHADSAAYVLTVLDNHDSASAGRLAALQRPVPYRWRPPRRGSSGDVITVAADSQTPPSH